MSCLTPTNYFPYGFMKTLDSMAEMKSDHPFRFDEIAELFIDPDPLKTACNELFGPTYLRGRSFSRIPARYMGVDVDEGLRWMNGKISSELDKVENKDVYDQLTRVVLEQLIDKLDKAKQGLDRQAQYYGYREHYMPECFMRVNEFCMKKLENLSISPSSIDKLAEDILRKEDQKTVSLLES